MFGGVLVLLWLVATNFENNLVFAATFLLSAMFVIAIFHTFLNLSGLSVEAGRAMPCFCGGEVEFGLLLSQKGRRYRDNISLYHHASEPVVVSLPGTELTEVWLAIPTNKRGWFEPGRITLETCYPLGLLRAWTYLDLKLCGLVYPRPIDAQGNLSSTIAGQGLDDLPGGREDFRGLERFRPGEALGHIAWKHYAREQGLHTKHYSDTVDEELWLDWDAFPGMDIEARLSRLCGWLLAISGNSGLYGLRIPGIEIAPSRGDAHRSKVLRALALFDQTSGAQS